MVRRNIKPAFIATILVFSLSGCAQQTVEIGPVPVTGHLDMLLLYSLVALIVTISACAYGIIRLNSATASQQRSLDPNTWLRRWRWTSLLSSSAGAIVGMGGVWWTWANSSVNSILSIDASAGMFAGLAISKAARRKVASKLEDASLMASVRLLGDKDIRVRENAIVAVCRTLPSLSREQLESLFASKRRVLYRAIFSSDPIWAVVALDAIETLQDCQALPYVSRLVNRVQHDDAGLHVKETAERVSLHLHSLQEAGDPAHRLLRPAADASAQSLSLLRPLQANVADASLLLRPGSIESGS